MKKNLPLLAASLLLLAAAATILPAQAAGPGRDQYGLTVFNSRFYEIHTNLSREQVLPYAEHMDLVFAHYRKRFSDFKPKSRGMPALYLLRTREQYHALLDAIGSSVEGSGGLFFYRGSVSGLATWVEGKSTQTTLSTLRHEGFHQFAREYIGVIPPWLNEGLAEYFEQSHIEGAEMVTGLADRRRIELVRDAIRTERALPLARLIAIGGQEWNDTLAAAPEVAHLHYCQSWSVIYFLIHGDGGRYQKAFERYLIMLSEGWASRNAFDRAFGADDITVAQRRWLQFALTQKPVKR